MWLEKAVEAFTGFCPAAIVLHQPGCRAERGLASSSDSTR